jgi:adenosylmethionine-8-amino-7-oxononanoate aminotransferase
MTEIDRQTPPPGQKQVTAEQHEALAKRHLLMHFARHGLYDHGRLPVIERGEGCWLWDARGNRYFDGLSGLFCVEIGYSHGPEIGAAVKAQMERLPYYTNWSCAHPPSIELAATVASLTPGDLNRIFFCSGGSEANESAMKLARQYFALRGQPMRRKMIARRLAYHGTTWGALSLNGITENRTPFEPLMPGVRHISNTDRYHRPVGETDEQLTLLLLEELKALLEFEDPATVACIFLEPVQNAGGSFVAPDGYFRGIRELCDRHGILVVADEVICGFGRVGEWFGSLRYDIEPDIITFAKGITSAYLALGGVAVSDRIAEVLTGGETVLMHGITFGGHPVACAAALANLAIMEREGVIENVRRHEPHLRSSLEQLLVSPIVGDVRGAGYLMALELVKDKDTRTTFNADERSHLLRRLLNPKLIEAGLICRAADYGEPVICLAPPLIAGEDDIDWMVGTVGAVLDDIAAALAIGG